MLKLLIVDDDADLLELVSYQFRLAGFNVHPLPDAKKIEHAIFSFAPDVILLDIYLPGASGLDICGNLKSTVCKEIPIILYSAGKISPQSVTDSKADAFISKPFEFDQLIEKIKRIGSS
jgi:DNA-binding response OmpR family regulator